MSDLYPEQQQAHDNLVKSRGGLLFWRVGTGKTRVALKIFATLQSVYKWPNPCIALFVCKPKCFYDIRHEIIKIGFDCVVLENDYEVAKEVQGQMRNKLTILLVSHAMLDKKREYFDRNTSIRMVILDDGYLFKNPKSGKTLAANRLTLSRRGLLMSGSVMTQQDPTDVYGQAFAVNQHRRIAPNLTKFRSKYFNTIMLGDPDKKQWPHMSVRKGAYQDIVKALGDAVDFYFPENAQRKIHHQIIKVPATPEQQKMFAELREWYSLDTLNVQLDYALQVSMCLQQISNGWTKAFDGHFISVPNNKIGRLIELVEDILAEGKQCVIWCAFKKDVEVICDALPFATLQMSGSHKFDIEKWKSNRFPVVVATEASGVGVNHFEQVPYAIYFSLSWKWLDLQQSRGRHDRKASLHNQVFYYYLQTEGGLDAEVYSCATNSEAKEHTLIEAGAVKKWMQNV